MAAQLDQALKPGLAVYDSDETMIGYVDQVDRQGGWFKVEEKPLGLRAVWLPYRLVATADQREVFVAATTNELHDRYASPPPRTTVVSHARGRRTATTTIFNGRDGSRVEIASVDVESVVGRLQPGYRVRSADDVELGKTKRFDPATGFLHVEKPAPWKRGLLVPVALVADVDGKQREVKLVINEADIVRLHRTAPADVVMLPTGD